MSGLTRGDRTALGTGPAPEGSGGSVAGKSTLVDAAPAHEGSSAPAHDGSPSAPRLDLKPSPHAPAWRLDDEPGEHAGAAEAEPGEIVSVASVGSSAEDHSSSPEAHETEHEHDHEHDHEHEESDVGHAGTTGGQMTGAIAHSPIGGFGPPTPALKLASKTQKTAASGADTRTTVGVGEIVDFTSTVAGAWSATKGTASGPSATKFAWTAPATAGTATIKVTSSGKSTSKTFKVIAPSKLSMKIRSLDSFAAGQQGVGMVTNVTVGPTSVSFGNVQWLEVPGPASSIGGYFKKFSAASLAHHPNPNWLQWNDKNTGLTDHAALWSYPAPWKKGGFQWNVPNKWRVASVGGAGHVFTTTHQIFRMTDTRGTTSVSKGGAHTQRTP